MDDFLGFIVLIIYFIAAASGIKKKAAGKRQRRQQARQERMAEFVKAFEAPEAMQPELGSEEPKAHQPAHGDACESERIHVHDVPQHAFHKAEEGEDPCHAGGAPEAEAADIFEAEDAGVGQNAFAQDVLRGMVMSEILTRPCDRAALRRNRRGTV